MTRGLILATEGVADSHLEYAYHRLREDAILVDVASSGGGTIRGDRGTRWDTVRVASLPAGRRYDLVVLPGGDAAAGLVDDGTTREWLVEYLDAGGIVCALADGVRCLVAIGALRGRLVAGPSERRAEIEAADATPTGEAVTVDGPFVTVRDTEALPFGIAAALASVAIPQDAASDASERPAWADRSAN